MSEIRTASAPTLRPLLTSRAEGDAGESGPAQTPTMFGYFSRWNEWR